MDFSIQVDLNFLQVNIGFEIIFRSLEYLVCEVISCLLVQNQWISQHPIVQINHFPSSKLEFTQPKKKKRISISKIENIKRERNFEN